jgi:hypothetical protein
MSYKYSNPIDRGYKKFKLTKKQHNEIFPYRKLNWTSHCEYYYNEKQILIHRFVNWKAVILSTLTFPVAVLLHGLGNIKEVFIDHYELYHQKKYGAFVSDHIHNSEKKFKQIMTLINKV